MYGLNWCAPQTNGEWVMRLIGWPLIIVAVAMAIFGLGYWACYWTRVQKEDHSHAMSED